MQSQRMSTARYNATGERPRCLYIEQILKTRVSKVHQFYFSICPCFFCKCLHFKAQHICTCVGQLASDERYPSPGEMAGLREQHSHETQNDKIRARRARGSSHARDRSCSVAHERRFMQYKPSYHAPYDRLLRDFGGWFEGGVIVESFDLTWFPTTRQRREKAGLHTPSMVSAALFHVCR